MNKLDQIEVALGNIVRHESIIRDTPNSYSAWEARQALVIIKELLDNIDFSEGNHLMKRCYITEKMTKAGQRALSDCIRKTNVTYREAAKRTFKAMIEAKND